MLLKVTVGLLQEMLIYTKQSLQKARLWGKNMEGQVIVVEVNETEIDQIVIIAEMR